ncbi:PaaX family transcriptional regulator [Streptomyces montanisoli]|uniref:PaaX family transcriptional regulator n=1 Tax=Streptomyces montanisoli TaxID=2798581 RepID=UPI0027DB3563|nr:PaaX family transcriptional regulator C-terminal domain-containing protein [Streptomyces montanisoli]
MRTEADGRESAQRPPMPRGRGGSSPQHLLVTLLGDYWIGQEEDLPSAGLIELLAEFGVTPSSARAALNRLLHRGLLEIRRAGRQTYYRLGAEASQRLAEGGRRIAGFGLRPVWDGTWTVVAFSVPEERRGSRHLLRSRLTWCGFAPLYDAVWVSASSTAAEARAVLGDLEIESASVLTTSAGTALGRSPLDAWDLRELATVYESFIEEASALLDLARTGDIALRRALVARTHLMDAYRRFPGSDPGLPSEHMPSHWPRDRARALFVAAYEALGPLAEARAGQIMARHDPGAAARARCRSISQLLRREADPGPLPSPRS